MKLPVLAACMMVFPLFASGAIRTEPMSDLRPAHPELPPPREQNDHIPWIMAGVGAAMILTGIFWPRRKPAPAPPDPHAKAKLALKAAANAAQPAEISAIVRRYAAEAFLLKGEGLTSEEVVSGLVSRRSCPPELANEAWRLLSSCDVASYAPHMEKVEAAAFLDRAARLIDELEAARAKAARTL